METRACTNCGASLHGEFCAACGQRRFRPADRALAHLLGQCFETLTDLDSRFWRSLRALMLQPGRLTADWCAGRRARWMSPIALFLLVNLVYFLFPAITDFDLPLRDHVRHAVLRDFTDAARSPPMSPDWGGQAHSRYTERWLRARVAERAAALQRDGVRDASPRTAFAQLEREYDQASSNYSKLLIVLHVPFLALALQLLMLGSKRYYAEHVVAALHYFTFVLAFVELVLLPGAFVAEWLGGSGGAMPGWVRALNATVLFAYAVLLVRRGYGSGWGRALLAGLALPVLLFAINITVYRALQFAIVFALA